MVEGNRWNGFPGSFAAWVGIAGAVLIGAATAYSQDFSKAFANLRQLGLPDTKGAEYGQVAPDMGRGYFGGRGAYSQFPGFYELTLSGNGWRIAEDKKAKTFTVILQQGEETVFSTAGDSQEHQAGKWKKIDVREDLKVLNDSFGKPEFLQQIGYDSSNAATFLLFAAHLDRQGLGKEASQLVKRVFSKVQDPEEVIGEAIGKVADMRYQTALSQLYAEKDWKPFVEQCRVLAEEFGAGWAGSAAVLALAEKISSQPAEPPTLVAPEGITLTDAHRQLAVEIAKMEISELIPNIGYFGNWLFLGEDSEEVFAAMSEDQKIEPIRRLIEKGLDSVPLLIAMLGDSYYLPIPRTNDGLPDDSISELIAVASNRQSEFQLPRPATRADIAASLLKPLVTGVEPYSDTGLEEFTDIARNWWKQVEGKSLLELARHNLQESEDEEQEGAILGWLAKNGEPSDFPTIEERMIDRAIDSPWSGFETISTYMEGRGEAAAPFLEKLETELDKHIASLKARGESDHEEYRESFDRNLKNLRSLLSSETAGDMLARVVAGEEELHTYGEAIFKKLAKEPYGDQVAAILDAALKSKDPVLRSQLLQWISYLKNTEEVTLDPADHAAQWKKLLADTEKVKGGSSIRVVAAWMIENLYDSEGEAARRAFYQQAGEAGREFQVSRAVARMEGKSGDDLPSYPSAESVSEERGKALTEELLAAAADTEEFLAKLNALTLSEKLWALGPTITPAEAEPEGIDAPLRLAIEKAQFTVSEVVAPEGWKAVSEWQGQIFDRKKLGDLREMALKKAAAGESFLIGLKRDPGFGPVRIEIGGFDPAKLGEDESSLEQILEMMLRTLGPEMPFLAGSFGQKQFGGYWFPKADAEEGDDPIAPRDPFSSMSGSQRDRFEQAGKRMDESMKLWLQAPVAFSRGLNIEFLGTSTRTKEKKEEEKTE